MKPEAVQLDAFASPGSMLRAEREAQGMTRREAADRLHFMPDYVAILERDDYRALRSPSFARSYIKAYGRLLGMDVSSLLAAYDRLVEATPAPPQRVQSRPVQLQRTGIGVVTGLAVLALLVVALWWWEEGRAAPPDPQMSIEALSRSDASLQFAGGTQ